VGEDVRAQRAGDCAVESEGSSIALTAGSACVVLAARCARSRVGTGGAEQTGVGARAAGHSVDRQVMVGSTAAAEAARVTRTTLRAAGAVTGEAVGAKGRAGAARDAVSCAEEGQVTAEAVCASVPCTARGAGRGVAADGAARPD
jgi:hypothetical protein